MWKMWRDRAAKPQGRAHRVHRAQGVADAFTCPGGIGQLRGQLGHSPAVSLQGLARQADN